MRMEVPPKPLLRRPQRLPGESLPSWLYRLAGANYYEPPAVFWELVAGEESGEWGIQTLVSAAPPVAVLARIAALTKADLAALWPATVHRFAPVLTTPPDPVDWLTSPDNSCVPILPRRAGVRTLRLPQHAQFCPACLGDGAYHRLIWTPFAVSVCLAHQCLLQDRCPRCGSGVSIAALLTTRCTTCGGDYTTAPHVSVAGDARELRAQAVLQAWLLEGVTPAAFREALPTQEPRVLYAVIDGLQLVLQRLDPAWPYWHAAAPPADAATGYLESYRRLTPAQAYCYYTTAFGSLLDWPHGFQDFVAAYYAWGNEARAEQRDRRLLYSHCLERRWQAPAFEFVQDAFAAYLGADYPALVRTALTQPWANEGSATGDEAIATIAQLAERLGVSEQMIRWMAQRQGLEGYHARDELIHWDRLLPPVVGG
jgi:hypothetical protein